MKIIGLTGGIGSGKTTVAEIFKVLDVAIYNSDIHARRLMEQDSEIKTALIHRYGSNCYNDEGQLNNSFLSAIVFNNQMELEWLNSLVHPKVGTDFNEWSAKQNGKFVIKESALLIETNQKQTVDQLILIHAPLKLKIKRIQERNHFSESEILNRMKNQTDDLKSISLADHIILNDGSRSLIKQSLIIYNKIIASL
jgi:dephospho-CoA kinase